MEGDCQHEASNFVDLSVHAAAQLQNLYQRLERAEPIVQKLSSISDQHNQLVERNQQTEDSNAKLSEQNAQLIASRKSDATMIANLRLNASRQTDLVAQLSKQIERLKAVDYQNLRLNEEKLRLIDKDALNAQQIDALKQAIIKLQEDCFSLASTNDQLKSERGQLLAQFKEQSKFNMDLQAQFYETDRLLQEQKQTTQTAMDYEREEFESQARLTAKTIAELRGELTALQREHELVCGRLEKTCRFFAWDGEDDYQNVDQKLVAENAFLTRRLNALIDAHEKLTTDYKASLKETREERVRYNQLVEKYNTSIQQNKTLTLIQKTLEDEKGAVIQQLQETKSLLRTTKTQLKNYIKGDQSQEVALRGRCVTLEALTKHQMGQINELNTYMKETGVLVAGLEPQGSYQ